MTIRNRFMLILLVLCCAAFGCEDKQTQEPKGEPTTSPEAVAGVEAETPRPVIRITGIPDENPTELARKHAPMTAYLSRVLDADVSYVPVTDYGAAVQALVAGKIDFAWLGGFTHVQSRILGETVPLVMRDIDRDFKSVFVAHVDAGVKSPQDLQGKSFAFGSKSSTSGHLMPRHFLTTEFSLNPDADFAGAPVFSGAHDATARMVESGKVQAGALNKEVWDRMVKEGRVKTDQVSVVWTTPGYVDYTWTARTAIDETLRSRFATAFLTLDANNEEHATVLALQGATKFVKASPQDFDAIEGVAKSTGLLRANR